MGGMEKIGMNFFAFKSIMGMLDIPFTGSLGPFLRKTTFKNCYNFFFLVCFISVGGLVLLKTYGTIVDENLKFWLILIFSVTGYGTISALWSLGYVAVANHMPLNVKATTMGMATGIAALGGALAPFVLYGNRW